MPFSILGIWMRGLVACALLGAGAYLLVVWYNHRETVVVNQVVITVDRADVNDKSEPGVREESVIVPWKFGINRETAFLLGGLALAGWSLTGGLVSYPRAFRKVGLDEPVIERSGEVEKLR